MKALLKTFGEIFSKGDNVIVSPRIQWFLDIIGKEKVNVLASGALEGHEFEALLAKLKRGSKVYALLNEVKAHIPGVEYLQETDDLYSYDKFDVIIINNSHEHGIWGWNENIVKPGGLFIVFCPVGDGGTYRTHRGFLRALKPTEVIRYYAGFTTLVKATYFYRGMEVPVERIEDEEPVERRDMLSWGFFAFENVNSEPYFDSIVGDLLEEEE